MENYLLIGFGIFGILTFIIIYELGKKTGIHRSFDHIKNPETRELIEEEREEYKVGSAITGSFCLFFLITYMIINWKVEDLLLYSVLTVGAVGIIFILPYFLGKKHPHDCEEGVIHTPEKGIRLD